MCSNASPWQRVRREPTSWRSWRSSTCVSADNAHAVHPNYRERHEPDHQPIVNRGPAIKLNSNQRYATSARSAAMLQRVFDEAGVPSQVFVSRNNMPCGSTIGPITATRLGIETVDVGVPQLSMHSARELCGVDDPISLADRPPPLLRAASDQSADAGLGDVEQALQLGVQVDGQLPGGIALRLRARRRSVDAWIGLPMTTCSLRGRMNFAPFGIARSEPPIPTGTIGTPAFTAMYVAPSNSGCTIGPLLRSPSGNSTSGSPPSSTAMHRRSASRSAVPRLTGKPPSAVSNRPNALFFQYLSAPMNRIRRCVTADAIGVSRMLR